MFSAIREVSGRKGIPGIYGTEGTGTIMLKLHFEGADGSTTIVDSSPSPKTITNNGVVVKSAQYADGVASGYFNGSTSYLTFPYNGFEFLSDLSVDYCISCWIRVIDFSNYRAIIQTQENGGSKPSFTFVLYPTKSSIATVTRTDIISPTGYGVSTSVNNGFVEPLEWTHLHYSYVASTKTMYMFINGVCYDSTVCSPGTFGYPTVPIRIGIYHHSNSFPFYGYMDSFIIQKQPTMVAGEFTPSVALPAIIPISASSLNTALTILFSSLINLDATNIPATTAFSVIVNGSSVSVNSLSVNASDKSVTLILASAPTVGQTVTVSYTDPTTGNDANAIQDAAGNDAPSFTSLAVTVLP